MGSEPMYYLTTVDNPFNPATQFVEWYNFDTDHAYHTVEVLARVVISSDELSEKDLIAANNMAIEEILELNALGLWRRVEPSTFPLPVVI